MSESCHYPQRYEPCHGDKSTKSSGLRWFIMPIFLNHTWGWEAITEARQQWSIHTRRTCELPWSGWGRYITDCIHKPCAWTVCHILYTERAAANTTKLVYSYVANTHRNTPHWTTQIHSTSESYHYSQWTTTSCPVHKMITKARLQHSCNNLSINYHVLRTRCSGTSERKCHTKDLNMM